VVRDFTVVQTILKAASSKMAKYEKVCFDNQHISIPFAFDTFGFLASEVVNLLKRVQNAMHSNLPKIEFHVYECSFSKIEFSYTKMFSAAAYYPFTFYSCVIILRI
jgi:hypothetical protein